MIGKENFKVGDRVGMLNREGSLHKATIRMIGNRPADNEPFVILQFDKEFIEELITKAHFVPMFGSKDKFVFEQDILDRVLPLDSAEMAFELMTLMNETDDTDDIDESLPLPTNHTKGEIN